MTFEPFKILRAEPHGREELMERIRQVGMLLDPERKPYLDADIALRRMPYPEIRPAQFYVLSDGLLKVRHLDWELKRLGHDMLDLDGYLTLTIEGTDDAVDLLPPVVERIAEADGSKNNILNDGMHRLYAGRLSWRAPRVIFVRNVPRDTPYYAYPIPGPEPWERVSIIQGDRVPDGFIKKWHRIPDNKLLYRDFNSAFANVGGPRGGGA
ncbi:MAG: hypothetical protein LBT40_11915 [Deltaproteobacteria bacterium]|jgi:hypothetical protein|nr:hypothetical protein [Deltaproteobacteria bacterium]